MNLPEPEDKLDFNTPEHIDWPECTEYPAKTGIHYDYEMAIDEPREEKKD